MKNIFAAAFFTLIALLGINTGRAQIFSGGIGVIGTSNAVVQNAFVTQTNVAFINLVGRTLQLQGITTNETVTVAYGTIWSGYGLTNINIGVTNQYTFPASNGYVQGQTVILTIPSYSYTVPITPIGQITITTNNGANVYSNYVLFQ
jgi:hypothetical protein